MEPVTPLFFRRFASLLLLLVAALWAFGCGGGSSTPSLASLTVNPAAPTIVAGATQAFTASAKDTTGAAMTGVTVTWASSNTAVATITSAGVVTGVAAGTTNITATSGGVTSAAVVLTVASLTVANLTIAGPASVNQGQAFQFTFTAKDANGAVIPPSALSGSGGAWASSSPAVATIGVADGRGATATPGTTQITFTIGTVTSAPATVTVVAAPTVTGTAAKGAPLAGATVTLEDDSGASVTTTTATDGRFTLFTSGLTPPFLVRVQPTSGNPLYSVSADADFNSVINVDPLTDLIINSWFAAGGEETMADAFADPSYPTPPSPEQVGLLSHLVVQVMQLWLNQNGVDTTTFNPISTAFAADGTGVDKVLDQTTVDTTAGTIKITDGTTTQNSIVTYDSHTGAVTINSTTTNGTSTSTSTVSTLAPYYAAPSTALAGISTTLNNLAATVAAKSAALTASDVSPYIASDLLQDGLSAALWADSLATDLRGQTGTVAVTQLASVDSTGTIADATFTFTTGSGANAIVQALEMPFKNVNNSWLMYGNQRLANISLGAEMTTNLGQQGSQDGPDVNIDVQPLHGTTTGATVTGGGIWNATAMQQAGQVDQTFQPTPSTSEDIFFDHSYLNSGILTTLVPTGTPFTITLTPTNGSPVSTTVKSNAFTTDPVVITGVTSTSMASLTLGQPVNYTWTLPKTYAISEVKLNAIVFTGDQTLSSTVSCEAENTPLPAGATSGSITIPATCNGQAVVQVNINLVVKGVNGERSMGFVFYQ